MMWNEQRLSMSGGRKTMNEIVVKFHPASKRAKPFFARVSGACVTQAMKAETMKNRPKLMAFYATLRDLALAGF
jgi:hypothetical protein